MKKNVASQNIGAQMVSATTGAAFSGSVTVAVTGDAGTQATGSVGSGACTHEGNGYHTYAPAQAETNYDLIAFTFTGTGAVPVTIQVETSYPQTGDGYVIVAAMSRYNTVTNLRSGTVYTGGTAIGDAVAAHTAGDTLCMGPGTYALGSGVAIMHANTQLIGPGSGACLITSTAAISASGAIVSTDGDNVLFEGFKVKGVAASAVFQAPIGYHGNFSQTCSRNVIVRDVSVEGDSDAAYFNSGSLDDNGRWQFFDCPEIASKFDAVAIPSTTSAAEIDFIRCNFRVTGPSTCASSFNGGGAVVGVRAVTGVAGRIRLIDCDVVAEHTATDSLTPVQGISARTTCIIDVLGKTTIRSRDTTATSAGVVDLIQANSAAINVDPSVTYSPSKTSGTITYLRGTALDTSGRTGINWADVGAPTTTQNLSGTTTKNTTDINAKLGTPAGASVSADLAATLAAIAAGVVKLKKNTAFTAFPFYLETSAGVAATGKTVTAQRSLDGAAFANCANAVSETSDGWYKINLAAADLNANSVALKFTATGAKQRNMGIITQVGS